MGNGETWGVDVGRNHPGIDAIGPGLKAQKGQGMACSQNTITVRHHCSKGQGGGLQRPGPEGLNVVLRDSDVTRKATRNQHEKDFVSALWWKLEDGLSHGGPVSKTAVTILPEEMA